MTLRTLWLNKTDPESWRLMPVAFRRIVAFSRQYSEDDPTGRELCQQLVISFTADGPRVVTILILDGDEIVGHLLLSLDRWLQQDILSIIQFQLDRPLPREFVRRELARVEEWGRVNGCSLVQAFAISEKLARAYRVFHGFDYYATIVRKPLAPGADTVQLEASPTAENP